MAASASPRPPPPARGNAGKSGPDSLSPGHPPARRSPSAAGGASLVVCELCLCVLGRYPTIGPPPLARRRRLPRLRSASPRPPPRGPPAGSGNRPAPAPLRLRLRSGPSPALLSSRYGYASAGPGLPSLYGHFRSCPGTGRPPTGTRKEAGLKPRHSFLPPAGAKSPPSLRSVMLFATRPRSIGPTGPLGSRKAPSSSDDLQTGQGGGPPPGKELLCVPSLDYFRLVGPMSPP